MKKILISFLVVIVLVGFWFYFKKPTLINLPIQNFKDSGEYYKTDLSYPVIPKGKYTEMSETIEKIKTDFMKDVSSITPQDAKIMNLGGDRVYNLYIETKVATSSKTISYIITSYVFEGGAHGITNINAFTYDKSGKIINLSQVLKGDYLNKLSQISREYFTKSLTDGLNTEMLNSGTEPKVENFSTWYLKDKTLNIVFGDYQIGPHAIGIQELPIDKNQISDILNSVFK